MQPCASYLKMPELGCDCRYGSKGKEKRCVTKADDRAGGDSISCDIQDKIKELQGKFTLKFRDQKAYYTFSQQEIKENADLIKRLRAEIQQKRILRRNTMDGDKKVITEGFKNDKESQLAMQRYTIGKAIREKREHVFKKANALNSVRHEKDKRLKKLKELIDAWIYSKKCTRTIAVTDCDQRSRVLLTSIEKMRLKYASACFIQRTYRKILRHLEEDNRLLPTRLEALEKSIKENRNELNGDWYQIQLDSRKAYEQAKHAKEKLEEKVIREKRHRDCKLAEVRKHFKRINLKEEENIKSRRMVTKGVEQKITRQPSVTFWENIRQFWKIKHSMDDLKESMSLPHASDIAGAFQRQICKRKELEQAVRDLSTMKTLRKKELKKYQAQLASIREQRSSHAEATTAETAANVNALTDVVKRSETQKCKLGEIAELLADADLAIRAIHQRLSSCDLIPYLIHQTQHLMTQTANTPTMGFYEPRISESDNIIEVLRECDDKLSSMSRHIDEEGFETLASDFPTEDTKEMLVKVTAQTPYNTRVRIIDEDEFVEESSFFEDDDDNNDQYLARDTIKSRFAEITGNQKTTKSVRQLAKE